MLTPAKDQAALNDANANAFSTSEPSSTATCPLEKGIILGVFFDGTGNNKYNGALAETNVARLWKAYKEFTDDRYVREKLYMIGVGAGLGDETVEVPGTRPQGGHHWWNNSAGLISGTGGKERINIAYRWVKAKCLEHKPPEHKMIDTYGFSRGASMARTFVNLINQALKKDVEHLEHRFLGIFDTVGSWGDEEPYVNEGLDSGDSLSWAHFTARHEHRTNFPLTKLPGADKEYTGVHSDVGGGYPDEVPRVRNSMAFVTCNHMYKRSFESHVDIDEPPKNGVDIEGLYKDSEEFGGGVAVMYDPKGSFPAQRQDWMATYVHDNTSTWNPAHWSTWSGKRKILEHAKKTLGSPPPNYTWK